MTRETKTGRRDRGGFTITELLIASTLTILVVSGSIAVFVSVFSSWKGISLRMEADNHANLALNNMVYGIGDNPGLRSASAVSLKLVNSAVGWELSYKTDAASATERKFTYSSSDGIIAHAPGDEVVGRGVTDSKVEIQGGFISIGLVVERADGRYKARREASTVFRCRNL